MHLKNGTHAGVGGFADVGIRDLAKRGLIEGPDIVTTGIFVTPDISNAVLWDERLYGLHVSGVETDEQLRQLVRINIDHGVDWIKTRTTDRAGLAERDPRRRGVVRRAYELGIPMVTGIDTYYRGDSFSRVSREVGFLVEQGVSPFDAIRGATSLAAEMLGIADETGSIQPGLDADLLVVDLNPLDDIRSIQDVLVVISNRHVVLKRIPFEKAPV